MAGISLLWIKRFTGTSLIFLRCGRWTIVSCLILRVPAINWRNRALVLLAKCCFLFHLSVSISNFPTVYPTRSAIDRFKRIFLTHRA